MFIPLLIIATIALIAIAYALLFQLLTFARGDKPISVIRRFKATPEAAWTNLEAAWAKTALTFQPTTQLPTEDRNTRIIVNAAKGRLSETILKVLPAAGAMSLAYRVFRENDEEYPFGRDHYERWTVLPSTAGSQIEISTQGRRSPLATVWAVMSLWRKAGLIAAGNLDATVGSPKPMKPLFSPARNEKRPARSRAFKGTQFSRELVLSACALLVLLIQFSWQSAIVLAALILFHEYGHLLSYQLTGKKGNRLMLVPFFGGIAVAGAPHKSEFERAFCALAGPGICTFSTVGALAVCHFSDNPDILFWSWKVVYFSSILNLLNLLPIYPLDGGHATESFFRSYFPSRLRHALIATSVIGLLVILGMGYAQTALFFGLFAFMSLKTLPQRSRLRTMSAGETIQITLGYAFIAAVHLFGYHAFFDPLISP